MLSGVGRLALITRSLSATAIAQELMIPGKFSQFNLNVETENKKAEAWIDGVKENVSSAIGKRTTTLQLAFQYLDWFHLQLAQDELATNVNVTLPIYKTVTVPATPFKITDADISSAGIASSVKAYVTDRGSWGEAGYLVAESGTLAAREFEADHTDTSITFHSGLAGASVTYVVDKAFTSIPSIGKAPDAIKIGEVSFIGKGYGPEFPNGVFIHIPSLTRSGSPSLQTDDVPTFEIPFDCNVASGYRTPVQYYRLP
ncbi:hypothetical protein [Synechococcus sp. PCC 6312]|uniref:hypothetical protein n=1 Tax=Synechococcus sp. (strain ATCC 27167 / PCC 6312) TaxID=195253 RepID=UPI00029EF5C6|nr:hypothetical protein [Synechococcus sp. PCC 6312]AFY60362.1 hypothetical protein Syn6312_1177 [Synechococcus sp. PCC 6312]